MGTAARSAFSLHVAAAILSTLPAVFAHGDEGDSMDMDMGMGAEEPRPDYNAYPPTYFTHPEHRGLIYAHIALMVLSWIVILPIGKEKWIVP
jgi:hypothetical protein